MQYKYFDHTADVMFEAYGKDLEETFVNSGLAMFNILTDITKVKRNVSFKISAEADKLEKLIFEFLDELIFLMDTEFVLISGFEKMEIIEDNNKFKLNCTALGDLASNYETHGDIKAPTYNEMNIKKTDSGYVFRVVVDI